MAKSRYANTEIIDDRHYATFEIPTYAKGYRPTNLLDGLAYEEYVWSRGDRFDKLAAVKLNDDNYWWVICLCNDITYPFGITPGTIIRIPSDVNEVLKRILP